MTSADEIGFWDSGAYPVIQGEWKEEDPRTQCHLNKYQTPLCLWQHVYILLAWDRPVLHWLFTRVGRGVKIYALSYVTDFNDKRYCTEKPADNLKVICVYSLSSLMSKGCGEDARGKVYYKRWPFAHRIVPGRLHGTGKRTFMWSDQCNILIDPSVVH